MTTLRLIGPAATPGDFLRLADLGMQAESHTLDPFLAKVANSGRGRPRGLLASGHNLELLMVGDGSCLEGAVHQAAVSWEGMEQPESPAAVSWNRQQSIGFVVGQKVEDSPVTGSFAVTPSSRTARKIGVHSGTGSMSHPNVRSSNTSNNATWFETLWQGDSITTSLTCVDERPKISNLRKIQGHKNMLLTASCSLSPTSFKPKPSFPLS